MPDLTALRHGCGAEKVYRITGIERHSGLYHCVGCQNSWVLYEAAPRHWHGLRPCRDLHPQETTIKPPEPDPCPVDGCPYVAVACPSPAHGKGSSHG